MNRLKLLLKITAISVFFFAVVIWLVFEASKYMCPIKLEYTQVNSRPDFAFSCNRQYAHDGYLECQTNNIYLTLRLDGMTVYDVAYYDTKIAVGDVMCLWGQPTGITVQTGLMNRRWITLWWSDRAVVLTTTFFTPHSKIIIYKYMAEPGGATPYHGFTVR